MYGLLSAGAFDCNLHVIEDSEFEGFVHAVRLRQLQACYSLRQLPFSDAEVECLRSNSAA